MRYATIADVNEHVQELMADAERSRAARLAHPIHPGHNDLVEFVASVASALRLAFAPAVRPEASGCSD
jgi:hypothetical protein